MTKYYSKLHSWVIVDGDEATVGFSAYGAEALGEIIYAELPQNETDLIVGDSIGVVESAAASQEVFSPISGTIVAVNNILSDDPGMISKAAETKGWICKLENIDLDELEELLDEEAYMEYIETL